MDLLARLCAIYLIVVAASFTVRKAYCAHHNENPSVYFSLIVSNAPTLNTSGVVSAVDRALEVVNSEASDVLPGVKLQYTSVLETQVRSNLMKTIENVDDCYFLSLHNALIMEGAINLRLY